MNIKHIHQLFLESNGICTDTRKLKKNQLFIALKGENFDGNVYAVSAIEQGASYAITDDPSIVHPKIITTTNALETLQDLAKFHRKHLNLPIIALTGSNGKTTTKELILATLSTQYNCIATKGNLNNHIGVPLTLLSMNQNTEIGVVEMGANHLKEIAQLCEIALPNYGYITNIGKAHLEGFGSEENILIGKTELYKHIQKNNGILFCNAQDKKLMPIAKKQQTIFFFKEHYNKISIELDKTSPFLTLFANKHHIQSNLVGAYNFTNIAAAITIANYFKIEISNIKTAIEKYIPKNNRSQLTHKGTNKIIMDAYNANPSSMKAAIDNFIHMKTEEKQKTVVLGDMFELGTYAHKEHQSLVDFLTSSTIKKVFLCGSHFMSCKINSDKIIAFPDTKHLISHLQKQPLANNFMLIKGSRGMKLEKILTIFD